MSKVNSKVKNNDDYPEKDLAMWQTPSANNSANSSNNSQSGKRTVISNETNVQTNSSSNNNNNNASNNNKNNNNNKVNMESYGTNNLASSVHLNNNNQLFTHQNGQLNYQQLNNQANGNINGNNYIQNTNQMHQNAILNRHYAQIGANIQNNILDNLPMYGPTLSSSSLAAYNSLASASNGLMNHQLASSLINSNSIRNDLIQNELINQANSVGVGNSGLSALSNRIYNSTAIDNQNSYINQAHAAHNGHLFSNHSIITPSPSQYTLDRLVNQLSLNGHNYPDLSYLNSINSNPYNKYSTGTPTTTSAYGLISHKSAENLAEPLIRRDNEIERLRMRIALLEQQVDTSNNLVKSTNHNSTNDSKLNKLEYEAALLRMEMGHNVSKDEQINKLERQLDQKEYEIQELKSKHKEELNKVEREANKYKSLLDSKEEESITEKSKYSNIQKENEKLQSKLKECNEYISQLPTVDEVKETEAKINEFKQENENLKNKINELDKKIFKAKQFIKDKNSELKTMQEKIEKCEMDKDKIRIEFENYKKATQSVDELMQRCEENSSLRAELECAKKMLNSLQEKLRNQQAKHDEKISSFKEEIQLELDVSNSLKSELQNKENLIKKLERSIKEISEQNQTLMHDNLNLNENIKSFEVLTSSDTIKLLQKLFKEFDYGANDLDELVKNCIDIYNGCSIDVNSLLGFSNRNTVGLGDFDSRDLANGLINNDYLIKKTNEIKKLRHKLSEVRKLVSDKYAEKVGENISCIQQ